MGMEIFRPQYLQPRKRKYRAQKFYLEGASDRLADLPVELKFGGRCSLSLPAVRRSEEAPIPL